MQTYVTPTELRSLVALVHADFGRRIDAVGVAVDAIQKASSTPRTAKAKGQTIKAKP